MHLCRIHQSISGIIPFALTCVLASSWAIAQPPTTSAADKTVQQLNQFLETGEFTLAVATAEQADAPEIRDLALAAIAQKQQAVGANEAAVETMAGIENDAIRGQLIGGGGGGQGGFGGQGGGFGGQGGGGGGGGLGVGGQGQQSQADFDTLIELITTTVDPDTWEEVGGQGTIAGFPGGVFVDARGVLRQTKSAAERLKIPREMIAQDGERVTISLPRLEKALQLRRATGLPPTPEMQSLGGLQRVESIHVYPETGDIVLSGPRAQHPSASLQLDDFVVVAAAINSGDGKFGCSINPRPENLRRTKDYLARTSQQPLKPGERPQWLQKLGESMGRQDIEVFGLPAATSTAQTLVNADYHMKLIGMGIQPGPAGLISYLDQMEDYADRLPPLDVLRWWFTANFDSIAVDEEQTVYQLVGDAVKVLSENELLDELGQRVATGQSHPVNKQFAADFTQHFAQLAEEYPFYARLRGIFELAVAAAIVFEEDLPNRVGWTPTSLIHDDGYLVRHVLPAQEVDSVVGHRVIGGTQIVAGISGGVSLDPKSVLVNKRTSSDAYALRTSHRQAKPNDERGRGELWVW